MEIIRTLLRLSHILGGMGWVGGSLFLTVFVRQTVSASGPEGGRFMQRLMSCTPLPRFMQVSALATTLGGLVLYWMDSGFRPAWILSREGLLFTVGGLAGVAAFLLGSAVLGPTSTRMAVLGREMQTAGGPPAAAQLAEMQALQGRMHAVEVADLALLVLAAVSMATARLW